MEALMRAVMGFFPYLTEMVVDSEAPLVNETLR